MSKLPFKLQECMQECGVECGSDVTKCTVYAKLSPELQGVVQMALGSLAYFIRGWR